MFGEHAFLFALFKIGISYKVKKNPARRILRVRAVLPAENFFCASCASPHAVLFSSVRSRQPDILIQQFLPRFSEALKIVIRTGALYDHEIRQDILWQVFQPSLTDMRK